MDPAGYSLRISTKEWVDEVFDTLVYYTGLRRKWRCGQTILFLHKTTLGDAIVGYGIVENVSGVEDLQDEERSRCSEHGWNRALTFRYMVRLEKPFLSKGTFLRDPKFRGRCSHGLQLDNEQVASLIESAESQQY